MKKIGILIDKYHLEEKTAPLLKYLHTISDVSLYVEESYLIDFHNNSFEEDIFFVKAKGDLVLSLAKSIENNTSIPIINSSEGIWLAFNRFLNSTLLKKAGIRVPKFSLKPKDNPPPFPNYIIKNVRDQKNYAFNPSISESRDQIEVRDKRALDETFGKQAIYDYLYYQEFIKSEWEYKVYGIGEELFFYRQIPILKNPNKMESRIKINLIPELEETTNKVMELFKLKIISLDFLKSEADIYYLSDVNCTPNFNYIKNGPKIVGDFLISQARN